MYRSHVFAKGSWVEVEWDLKWGLLMMGRNPCHCTPGFGMFSPVVFRELLETAAAQAQADGELGLGCLWSARHASARRW